MAKRPHVVIVGAGFGGLAATRALRHVDVDVTIVDRNNYHLFQPLLYQVASGLLDPSAIASPVRTIVRRSPNVDVLRAEVTSVDVAKQQVKTSTGTLDYDYLIIATGSVTDYFGNQDARMMATVGRGAAVAQIGPVRINGLVGWFIWIFIHLLYLVGFRNRALALWSWAWNYFFWDRPVRLIIAPPADGQPSPPTAGPGG
jgi:NADH dehydrogenase FAD-containing subunit